MATACGAASLLLGLALRRTLRSRWWLVPALVLLVAGAARFAYVEIVHPSG